MDASPPGQIFREPVVAAGMVREAPWNLHRAIRPLLLLSRALGLAPVQNTPGGLIPYNGAIIWTALLSLLLVCSAVIYLIRALGDSEVMDRYSDTESSKAVYTIILEIVLMYGSGLCALVSSNVLVSRRLNALLSCFASADRVLFADTEALYRRTRIHIIIVIVCIILVLSATFIYDAVINGVQSWFCDILPTYPLVFCVLLETQMCVIILALRSRFRRVNAYFEALLNESRSRNNEQLGSRSNGAWKKEKNSCAFEKGKKPSEELEELNESLCYLVFSDTFHGKSETSFKTLSPDKSSKKSPDLTSLFQVHDVLCHGMQLFNEIFGLQMLIELMGLFIGIISGVFYSVKYGIQWCIHSLLNDIVTISVLSVSGYLCTSSANSTAFLVSRLLLRPTSPDVRRLLTRFASQLLHARTRIFICGLLVLDNALLARMAGAIATYTVILVEYQGAQETTSLPGTNTTLNTDVTYAFTNITEQNFEDGIIS